MDKQTGSISQITPIDQSVSVAKKQSAPSFNPSNPATTKKSH